MIKNIRVSYTYELESSGIRVVRTDTLSYSIDDAAAKCRPIFTRETPTPTESAESETQ